MTQLQQLENEIKSYAPNFEIRFKDESKFMKLLSKLLFFNKSFSTNYVTTIGEKVYWPTRKSYTPNSYFTLAHEFVHIMDYKKSPIKFILGYSFPQILSLPFLLLPLLVWFVPIAYLLPFALFLLPLPSPTRTYYELRGYGMTIKSKLWNKINPDINHISKNFTSSNYYYMWPFKNNIISKLNQYNNLSVPSDTNPAWNVLYRNKNV